MEPSLKSLTSVSKFKMSTNPFHKRYGVSEEENKAITELKKIYIETVKLDIELQRKVYTMERTFEPKHNEIFDKRLKIIEDFKKHIPNQADESTLKHFWLKVLKASYTEFISKSDEKILAHLIDIRSKLHNDSSVRFVIEFFFEPNKYFTNKVLTKTYYLNCNPDPKDPLLYDGAEIFKCEGCQIDWTNSPTERKEDNSASFFEFFTPPMLPEPEDPNYSDLNAILQNDFELGFYLKERVIPKAILFFTGEIADCQTSESEGEDSDEEDDDDEDEDDEDEDVDEDEDSGEGDGDKN